MDKIRGTQFDIRLNGAAAAWGEGLTGQIFTEEFFGPFPATNIITSVTYTASSNFATYTGLTNAADMRDGDYLSNDSIHGTDTGPDEFIQADFGSVKNIYTINVAPINNAHPDLWTAANLNSHSLEYSTNGTSWTLLTTLENINENLKKTYYVDISARYVRISASDYIGVGDFWFEEFVESAPSVSGTFAATEAQDTMAASGSAVSNVTGTFAVTETADTMAASGVQRITGTFATTEASDTMAATGVERMVGTFAVTEAQDTMAASGVQRITGAFAATETADTMASSGLQTITGTFAVTEASDNLSADANAAFSVTGEFAVTEASDAMAATGNVANDNNLQVQVAGGSGYNYTPRKKRDIIKEVMDEIKEAVEQETLIPKEEIKRLSPLFDRARFKEIQRQIAIINQRIEDQRLLDLLAQERADLRRLIFTIENSLMQEMRLLQEDEELLLVLNI